MEKTAEKNGSKLKKIGREVWNAVKNPMAYMYAGAFSMLAGVSSALISNSLSEGIERGVDDSLKNLLFFGPLNVGYARAIEYVSRKFSNHPYIAANAVCLATNAAFAAYAYLTGDDAANLQSVTAAAAPVAALGLALIHKQTRTIRKNKETNLETVIG